MNLPVPTDNQAVVIIQDQPPAPDRCPVTIYLTNTLTTESSRAGMASNLRRAARVLTEGATTDATRIPWASLPPQYVGRIRTLLLDEGAKPTTVNATLCAVRGVLQQCYELELIDGDRLARALRALKTTKGGTTEPAGRMLATDEYSRLFTVCRADATPAGRRDAALLALAIGAGLRRAELCGLTMADYDHGFRDEYGRVYGRLTVTGKGRKTRTLYVDNGAREALGDWLDVRGPAVGPIFAPVTQAGDVLAGRCISGQAATKAMAKRADQACIADFSPHDCRRTYISQHLDAGTDIATVAALAGHASVATTQRYDRRGERAKMAAAGTIHLPYAAPTAP